MYLLHTRLLRTACSRICAPLRSVLDMCHRHTAPSKAFVIRSFFFEKWLLTHAFGGEKVQNTSCKQACVGLLDFFTLVLGKQRLDLLKQLAVRLDLILISNYADSSCLKDCLRDRCKGADIFHGRV